MALSTPLAAEFRIRAGDDDRQLVILAQSGHRAAFEQLAARHSTRLRRVLFRITHDCDAAYDAVQDALMRAWKNIARFEGRSQFSIWLTRIGIDAAHRGLRRPVEEPLELADQVGERIPSWSARSDEIAESREFLAAIAQALGELPPDYAEQHALLDSAISELLRLRPTSSARSPSPSGSATGGSPPARRS